MSATPEETTPVKKRISMGYAGNNLTLSRKDATKAQLNSAAVEAAKWVDEVLGIKLLSSDVKEEDQSDKFCEALESGEVLCALVQKFHPETLPTYHKNVAQAKGGNKDAQARENLFFFKKACEKLQVNEATLLDDTTIPSKNAKTLLACIFQLQSKVLTLLPSAQPLASVSESSSNIEAAVAAEAAAPSSEEESTFLSTYRWLIGAGIIAAGILSADFLSRIKR